MDMSQNNKSLKQWSYLAKKLINKTKNREKVPSIGVVEVVLFLCNLVDNQNKQKSKVLHSFTPNKSYACRISSIRARPQISAAPFGMDIEINAFSHKHLHSNKRRIVTIE